MRTESCRDEHEAHREELFGALVYLRQPHPAPTEAASTAWRAVMRHVERTLPRGDCEDDRQAALLAILESVGSLRATTPASAAGWVRRICRNERIDGHRRRHLGRDAPYDEGRAHAPSAEPMPPVELVERVLDAFVARIDGYLVTTSLRPSWRARRRLQAVVALRRLALEEPLAEVACRLGLNVSLTLLTKWVERGRSVILATIEHDRARDPDVADFFVPLAELARARRSDAGRPRPERRRASP